MARNNGSSTLSSPYGKDQTPLFERLIKVGMALSTERDKNRLMETILLESKAITNADGGTLYIRGNMIKDTVSGQQVFEASPDGNQLKFEIMRTDSLKIAIGGTTGKDISLPPLYILSPDRGEKNLRNVATASVLKGTPINIADAYKNEEYDFSGTKIFDRDTGYRSKSFLAVPLKNNQGDIIGVLQLLNARDFSTGKVTVFHESIQPVISALASQAAVALDNQQLIAAQKNLLDSFIKLIASAIDAKSPYTGSHCQRVPELSMMLIEALENAKSGPFSNFAITPEERYEIEIASLLHDCGKVTTPEHVIDKSTKLETIYNRIHEIRTRFEVIKRDRVIDALRNIIDQNSRHKEVLDNLKKQLHHLDDDFAFVADCNLGGEDMEASAVKRIKSIAKLKWIRTLSNRIGLSPHESLLLEGGGKEILPAEESVLADRHFHKIPHDENKGEDIKNNLWRFNVKIPKYKYNFGEIYNLCIKRGTLTDEERYKINDHIAQTIMMLETLPFPRKLARVPEYAGGHHEKMNGTGYPRGLLGKNMSIPARVLAVADVFEALTANDRPYKKPKKLSECLDIMYNMTNNEHLDSDLFELFLTSGVYESYSKKYLDASQVDVIDISKYISTK